MLNFFLRQNGYGNISFSQCGEDMIMKHIFYALKIERPTYLDIGAHDPRYINNSFYFYKKGSRGVLVEPDPEFCKKIRKARKGDVCLNVGVSVDDGKQAAFYVMTAPTLSTFSKEEAHRIDKEGVYRIAEVKPVELMNINAVIEQYFPSCPNFVSIDVEGWDYKLLKTFDFQKYRPEVFCVETIAFSTGNDEYKITEIVDFMQSCGYFVYADTYINTIFVEKSKWQGR